ncbi:unnamed protein product [Brassicogethes aeneus]|uniref:Uncharacterized protein n=1 Tax=Brassicogethes aeneus TaxID=1431903 RepID=A0A9P0FM19_BRAAE|nr:unnamed protein product [Brassicogethes aeneus]
MSKPKVKKTRAGLSVHLFGTVTDLDPEIINVLPTYQQVMLCYESVRIQLKGEGSKEPPLNTIANIVAEKIKIIWQRASLPILTHKRIVDMILSYHAKYKNIIKPFKSRDTPFLSKKLETFKNSAQKLFDICSCKCSTFQSCKCPKEKKVSEIEWPFIIDQRNDRKMLIGPVDRVITKKLQKKLERQAKNLKPPVKGVDTDMSVCCHQRKIESPQPSTSGIQISTSDDSDADFECPKSLKPKRPKIDKLSSQMRVPLTHTAKVADLTGVSSRVVAKITTAVLEDMNIVSASNTSKVIDKNKVRREIKRNRKQLTEKSFCDNKRIKGLYFDGRKDQTLEYVAGKRIVKPEEHIALVEEPNSQYFGHLSLFPSVKAVDLSNGIIRFLSDLNIDTQELQVIGCNGTNVNTGWKGGAIRYIEVALNKPLQWSICLLHSNELPLRHLLQNLDGHTKGPYSFSGPIGKLLNDCELKSVENFQIIYTELPEIEKNDLSMDQKYLFDICKAIKSGTCCESVAKRNPGKISHSRWLTTANRILRLYISTINPSENFQILVEFIMKVYAPMWFKIKSKPFIQDGARHLWDAIRLSRPFPDHVKVIVYKVFEGNAYFGHPENILIAMMTDERQHIRQLAVKKILKIRKNLIQSESIRIFKIPKLNFSADDYIDLIDWSQTNISEPPLTMSMTEDDLNKLLQTGEKFQLDKFPCHTQAVERMVKIITDASTTVCGQESREVDRLQDPDYTVGSKNAKKRLYHTAFVASSESSKDSEEENIQAKVKTTKKQLRVMALIQ